MDEAQTCTALRQYWMVEWPLLSAVPYVWEDDALPGDLDTQSVRVTIRPEGGARVAVGRTREENRGLIQIEVSTPRKVGPGPGERVGAQIAQLWRAFRHERIRLSAPSVVGLAPDGAFNRHLVTLGWRGDMRFAAQ